MGRMGWDREGWDEMRDQKGIGPYGMVSGKGRDGTR